MEQSKPRMFSVDSKNTDVGLQSPPYSRTTTLVASPTSPAPAKPSLADKHCWRVASAFLCFFAIGWGDASTGVLMPEIQDNFNLDFTLGSMLFMAGSVSYALATFIVAPSARLLGRYNLSSERGSFLPLLFSRQNVGHSNNKGRYLSLFVFGLFHCAYFLIAALSPQYAGVLAGFFIGGVGKSVLIAQINVFWTTNPRLNGIALLHGVYGVGALVSPLICQTLKSRGYSWRNFFYISLGLAVFNVAYGLFAFRPTQSEFQVEKQLALASQALSATKGDEKMETEPSSPTTDKKNSKVGMLQAMAMPYVWAISVFLGVYQGAETIAQGFIVTFLLHERQANPSTVGYAASGFWAGLALGRVIWGILSPRFSQKVKIFYVNTVLVLGIGFHTLIWRVESVLIDSIMVALLGLLAGPTFPLILDIATNPNTKQAPGTPSLLPVLSAEIQLTALALASSTGAIGGAIFSLSAGVAANAHGAYVVEPLAMATLGFVFCFWVSVQIISKLVRRASSCIETV